MGGVHKVFLLYYGLKKIKTIVRIEILWQNNAQSVGKNLKWFGSLKSLGENTTQPKNQESDPIYNG